MIFLFAFLFIFWGTCLYCAQTVRGWKWPTLAALRPGEGVSGHGMKLAYWSCWAGLYMTSAAATACSILQLCRIMDYQDEDPVLWAALAVGIPVMMYYTFCCLQDLERENSRASLDDF